MHEIFAFLGQHWLLSLAFVIVLLMIIVEEKRTAGGGGKRVQPQKVIELMNRQGAKVLDIRSKSAFQSGHIIDAINIALTDLEANQNRIARYMNSPLIVVCDQGRSAGLAATKLAKLGFTEVYVLAGGLNAWKTANLPLKK